MAMTQQAVAVIDETERAAAALDPLRLRILEQLRDEADSAAGVAQKLGLPRQRVTYHVRALEDAGLLEAVGERRRRNFMERLVRAKARAWVIGPQALGCVGATEADVQDRFSSSYLLATAARSIREVAELRRRADAAEKQLQTFTLETEVRFASPAELNAFVRGVSQAVAELAARHHDEEAPAGRRFRFGMVAYPAVAAGTSTPSAEEAKP